ncbi:protease required for anti-sigma degradation [Nannochloropsis oceanica]
MSASPGRGRPPNSLPDLYRPVASTTYQGSSSTQYQPPPHQATSRTNSVSSPSGGSGVFAIPVSSNTIPVGSTTYPHSDRSTIGTYVEPPPGESIGNGVGQQQLTAIDQPNANAENLDCCTSSCASLFFKWFLLYIILITIAAVIAARLLPELGLFLLSVLPAMTLLSFLETQFRKSVIRMQMLISFFEAVLWMVPIVILENLTNYFLIVRTKLPKEGYCGMCILSAFLQAYLIAGLFEESVKYLAVRRIINKSYVVDPRALVVYSCCAGSAFGTVEDLMYNLSYGLGTGIVRAFTSVPLHCATGLIIGTSLAERKFFEQDTERWYKTLILPVLIHGTYDFASFVLASGNLAIVGFAIGVVIVISSYVYVRKRVLFLLKAFPIELNAHEMMINGEIEAPGIGCCKPSLCPTCYL